MSALPTTGTAVVAHEPTSPHQFNVTHSKIALINPNPGPNELLIRMVASGICHTDIVVGSGPSAVFGAFPKVLGHEGTGYVLAVGDKIKDLQVGEPVALSYTYCGECDLCMHDHPAYCQKFVADNAISSVKIWRDDKTGEEVGGKFFGQSSFASLSLVNRQCVVSLKGLLTPGKENEEMILFAPLGCGLQTGSGAVLNCANASERDVIIVCGMGAVGLGVVMAAKARGCKKVVAVDRIKSRLEIAKQVGATDIFDTNHLGDIHAEDYAQKFVDGIRQLTGEIVNFAFECTGVIPLSHAALLALSKRGKLIQIGVPIPEPTSTMKIDMSELFNSTKRMEVIFMGECRAPEAIPKLIQWYREGKFPFDKMVKMYKAADVQQALEDMKVEVIKPILVH